MSRETLISLLRPKFDPVQGVGVMGKRAEDEIVQLTEDQLRFLDVVGANPRVAVIGAGGTGKTLLAFEQARIRSSAGDRVLVTCFNRLLAKHLSRLARERVGMERVDVLNYHQLIYALIREADLELSVPEEWGAFSGAIDRLALNALDHLDYGGRYDYLVVDEAQDLMDERFFNVLDLLLVGGISAGRWAICVDLDQSIFNEQFDRPFFERVIAEAVRVPLTVNCRNTKQVASYVRGLSACGETRVRGANGPEVRIHYYDSDDDFKRLLRHRVNVLITDVTSAGLAPSDIAILTTDESFMPRADELGPRFLRPLVDFREHFPVPREAIGEGTVQAFKGLEAGAVVLIGLQSLAAPWERKLLYVGASRARWCLDLLLPRRASEYVQTCIPDILRALDGPV